MNESFEVKISKHSFSFSVHMSKLAITLPDATSVLDQSFPIIVKTFQWYLLSVAVCSVPDLTANQFPPAASDSTANYGENVTFTCAMHQETPIAYSRQCVFVGDAPNRGTYGFLIDDIKNCQGQQAAISIILSSASPISMYRSQTCTSLCLQMARPLMVPGHLLTQCCLPNKKFLSSFSAHHDISRLAVMAWLKSYLAALVGLNSFAVYPLGVGTDDGTGRNQTCDLFNIAKKYSGTAISWIALFNWQLGYLPYWIIQLLN